LKPPRASTPPTASDDVRLESDSRGARNKSWWIDGATLVRGMYDVDALAVEVVEVEKETRPGEPCP
jgi:hypothetical protein